MRRVGCILGWFFMLAALAVALWEILGRDPDKGFQFRPAGELWNRIDADSLGLVQVVIERYIWPPLWDPVLFSLLLLVLALAPGIPTGGMAIGGEPLTVFAAASLTEAMTEAGLTFEQSQGVAVRFSFAASSTLARQIEAGAPAGLIALASLTPILFVMAYGIIWTRFV